MKKQIKMIFLVFFLALLQIACSSGPTDEETKLLITSELKKEFPTAWVVGTKVEGIIGNIVSNTMKATNIEIESIVVKQRGNFNEQEKYWPVKVQIKGTFQRELIGNRANEKVTFDKEADFRFSKDDYDNWKISLVEK